VPLEVVASALWPTTPGIRLSRWSGLRRFSGSVTRVFSSTRFDTEASEVWTCTAVAVTVIVESTEPVCMTTRSE
jgi:hypothetical protein